MNLLLLLLSALGGAGIMYLTDPQTGKGRREMLREQMNKAANQANSRLQEMRKEAEDRAEAMMSEAQQRIDQLQDVVEDEVLEQRIRAELGHIINHPTNGITVTALNGRVMVRGNMYAYEVDPFIQAIQLIPGVREVVNELTTHVQTAEDITTGE